MYEIKTLITDYHKNDFKQHTLIFREYLVSMIMVLKSLIMTAKRCVKIKVMISAVSQQWYEKILNFCLFICSFSVIFKKKYICFGK